MTEGTQSKINATQQWLQLAPEKYHAIVGTIPSGSAGGAQSNITWQSQIPTQPAFITRVEYLVTMEVQLTLAAGASATLSPFAPWCFFKQSFDVGGTAPWSPLELTAFYLDDNRFAINHDPNYTGLGDNAGYFSAILSEGPTPNVIGGSGSLAPGSTVTNSGTASATYTYTFTFSAPQRLMRRAITLWGALPTGDASYVVENTLQLSDLVGSHPEQNAFVNATSGTTCVTSGTTSVTATYTLRSLNASVSVAEKEPIPTPKVGFGLQVNRTNTAITSVGAWQFNPHRTGMLYLYNAEIYVNGQSPLNPSGMALSPTEDLDAARTIFDADRNTIQAYWNKYHRVHGRYPMNGVIEWDLERGDYPPIPSLTPFRADMTPSRTYAQVFNIPPTPAMATFYKFPSTTTLANGYVVNYDFGLTEVAY